MLASKPKNIHVHTWVNTTKDVVVARFRHEDGELKYIVTTGKDTLKQRKCECGMIETYDLIRKIV